MDAIYCTRPWMIAPLRLIALGVAASAAVSACGAGATQGGAPQPARSTTEPAEPSATAAGRGEETAALHATEQEPLTPSDALPRLERAIETMSEVSWMVERDGARRCEAWQISRTEEDRRHGTFRVGREDRAFEMKLDGGVARVHHVDRRRARMACSAELRLRGGTDRTLTWGGGGVWYFAFNDCADAAASHRDAPFDAGACSRALRLLDDEATSSAEARDAGARSFFDLARQRQSIHALTTTADGTSFECSAWELRPRAANGSSGRLVRASRDQRCERTYEQSRSGELVVTDIGCRGSDGDTIALGGFESAPILAPAADYFVYGDELWFVSAEACARAVRAGGVP